MIQNKKTNNGKLELPATLKEAVQGREDSSNNSILGIDINHFKHTLDLFKYSLDYAEAIVNTVREPLVILNKDLQVITANRAFYQTFDLLPDKLENRPFYELGGGELNIPKFRKLLHRVLTTGKSFENFEIEYHVPKLGKRVLLLNARKFYRQINATQTILLAIEDVTKVRAYEKHKDEFAAVIMHELKGPVSTISGYLQLIQAHLSKRDDKKLLKYADHMEDQVQRLTSLINGLLNSSKIRAVGFEYSDEKIFDMNELITQIIQDTQKLSKTHRIFQEGKVIRYVKGDPERIGQVLINLLINAIRYSPNATKVVVKSSLKDGKVIITVEDFGVGISKVNQKKVFERFFRLNDSNKETYYGVGLGLDISSQIIHHYKGKIWIEGKESKGTMFHFSLPVYHA
ncbi:MAG TPA: PAS domain-containing sensor histidine kinase [Candidatus Saccharimonadales bacterium]|nr:PAS domain-containing sensor histidine kinase [Candidatus Saccharimonadales bacterium]